MAMCGVVVAHPRQAHVFIDDCLFLLTELLDENALQRLKANTRHAERGANCQGVLGYLVAADVGQLGNRERAELHAVDCFARLDGVGVVDTGASAAQ
jgi:hypothetical protein